jgi:outer membrane biogenesis lipoprotein LolB
MGCAYRVWCASLREDDHFEDLGIDGRIILKLDFQGQYGRMDWIYKVQDSDRWRVPVNAKMNFGFLKMRRIS